MALVKNVRRGLVVGPMLSIALVMAGTPAMAHPDTDVTDGPEQPSSSLPELHSDSDHPQGDPSAPLAERDGELADIISSGPAAKVTKNLAVAGRGERLLEGGTTDVWAHDGYAYLGTFNEPCGTGEGDDGLGLVQYSDGEGPGIAVFDVHNANKPSYVGNIPSVEGSRINDVKVFESVDGTDLLVHSNEGCGGGPGGFRVYDVSDVTNAVLLAEVQTDDINVLLREQFGYTDFGVHNLYSFTKDGRQYVAAQVESLLGNFQIFDLTDPSNPVLAGAWGAEELLEGYKDVDWATTTDLEAITAAEAWLLSGFGASQNRFLHDFWVAADGSIAYLANWDAGLVRLDLTDLANPTVVSVALDPTSEDGEVNSHSVWPTADGKTVIEGEEDFAPFKTQLNVPLAGIFDAAEASFTPSIGVTESRSFTGPTTYIGLGCNGAAEVPSAPSEDAVAVVQRGVCSFSQKVAEAEAAGYAAVIIFNDAARGDAVLTPGGTAGFGDPTIPAIFVGHSAGLAILGVDSADDLVIGAIGETATGESVPDGWSGFRIWDYSDPANPVLASTFNTVCSANPLAEQCDPRGTYSSHNVIVDGTRAYISWYSDGVVVLDLSDPYNPVEVARYSESGPAFEAQNGGIQDVWGVYKEPGRPFIYASDRNGGLYVLKEYGAGSAKNGKAVGGKGGQK